MKNIFATLIVSILSFGTYSQDISIDCQLESGTFQKFYKKTGTTIFEVNSSGKILEILVFDTEESAGIYMRKPHELNKPNQAIDLGEVSLYIERYTTIKYYSPGEYNSGKTKRIGDLSLKYFNSSQYNSGKLKQIGDIFINYYTSNQYHSGKLKSIGNTTVNYFTPTQYNPRKIKAIGDIKINYYTTAQYNSGKLKFIGLLNIKYYTPNEYNSGKLKEVKGIDTRFRLI